MQEKMENAEFTNDMQSLLRPGISFTASDAYPQIYETFIDKMEGKRDSRLYILKRISIIKECMIIFD